MNKVLMILITGVLLLFIIVTLGNKYQEHLVNKQLEEYPVNYDKMVVEINDDKNNLINLPLNIYNTVNFETEIYYKNLLQNLSSEYKLKFSVDNNELTGTETSVAFTKLESGIGNLEIKLYKDEKIIAVDNTKIITSNVRETPIKGLVLGDSTIITYGDGHVTQRLIYNLGNNIKLVGTMGDGINNFEGRGGWTAAMYRTGETYAADNNKVNAFYNPSIDDFDFEYYMTNQGYNDLDFVIINLGINDVFRYTSDENLVNDFENIIKNYDHIINSINSYDNSIRIALNLTIPPSSNKEMFKKDYGESQSLERVKSNNYLWTEMLIDHYKDSEVVDLVPIYLGIDTTNNYENGVHPNVDGYKQIGDQITSYLNSLE